MPPDPLQLCRHYGLPLTKILATLLFSLYRIASINQPNMKSLLQHRMNQRDPNFRVLLCFSGKLKLLFSTPNIALNMPTGVVKPLFINRLYTTHLTCRSCIQQCSFKVAYANFQALGEAMPSCQMRNIHLTFWYIHMIFRHEYETASQTIHQDCKQYFMIDDNIIF